MLLIRLALVFAILVLPSGWASAQAPKQPSAEEIQKLIDGLSSKKFTERESATRKLSALDDVPAALEIAAGSKDAEVARRAKSAITAIMKRHEAKFIARDLADLNAIGVDRFLDRMVLTTGFERESRWQTLVRAAEAVIDRASKMGYSGLVLPQVQWAQFPIVTELPPRYLMSSRVVVQGSQNRSSGFRNCMVLSSDTLSTLTRIQDSIIYVNGDLSRVTGVYNSIIICNGNIGSISTLTGSVILCTGEITSINRSTSSLIEARKLQRLPAGEGNMFVNEKAPEDDDKTNRFVKTDQTPFRTLKLFEPDLLGLKVKLAGHTGTVEDLLANTTAGKSDLKKGDAIISIGGEKWSSDDEFRALLRRKSIQESVQVQVRRDGKEIEIKLKFE